MVPDYTSPHVAVLFARRDSIYKRLPCTMVFDIDRDARTYIGDLPIIAHPPCRAWGRLHTFANPRPDEKALAPWAVSQVLKWGGVLEHPAHSSLWSHCGLPLPGQPPTAAGTWSLSIDQHWFGHRARKRTWLLIHGITPRQLPAYPLRWELPTHVISTSRRARHRLECSKSEREHTPELFARWLIQVCQVISTTYQPHCITP